MSSLIPSNTDPTTSSSLDNQDSKKRPAPDHQETEEDEDKKLQARREANRLHAFKSRQRSKMLLQELQQTVEQLTRDKTELERHNAVLRAQVEVLQSQNASLMQNQQIMMRGGGGAGQQGMTGWPMPWMGMPVNTTNTQQNQGNNNPSVSTGNNSVNNNNSSSNNNSMMQMPNMAQLQQMQNMMQQQQHQQQQQNINDENDGGIHV